MLKSAWFPKCISKLIQVGSAYFVRIINSNSTLQVLYHEMTAIQRACTQLEKDYTPNITFIVVQKRHHARFTCSNPRDADRSGNCPPGTTIDTAVCHPTEFDYYQYSHAGIQGTSRPTHYHVLWDDSDFNADELQSLSFMLCHLYVRCTRSVSIPAPAYYAHHVAFRARYHLQKEEGSTSSDSGSKDEQTERLERNNLKAIVKPHPKLASKMYFVWGKNSSLDVRKELLSWCPPLCVCR